jgi:hypothetical protein
VSGSSSTREFALVEEAGRHGVQMDVLVHDTAGDFCSRDCRLSSARRAVTHAPRLDSSLSFGETGLVGERNLPWPTSVSSAGRRPNVSSALVEYRAIANGRSTSLSGQTLAGCEAAAWMMPTRGRETGPLRSKGIQPGVKVAIQLAAILCHQIRCNAESAPHTWQRFWVERVGRSSVLPTR